VQLEVVKVVGSTPKPAKEGSNYGDKQSIKMQVKGDFKSLDGVPDAVKEGRVPLLVEWYTNATTVIPTEGEKLDGELTLGNYGWQFKKAGQGGGGGRGGGGAPKDPKDNQRIVRQHTQKCAVELMNTAHELGLIAPVRDGETPLARVGELVGMVKTVAEHLEAHVYRGMDAPIKIDGFDVVPRQPR
jgi:hypothetical protein